MSEDSASPPLALGIRLFGKQKETQRWSGGEALEFPDCKEWQDPKTEWQRNNFRAFESFDILMSEIKKVFVIDLLVKARDVYNLFKGGISLGQIGLRFKISKQRVWMLKNLGRKLVDN